jgi:hypothetical protein
VNRCCRATIAPQGQTLAAFVCPGHPLLDATLDLTLERHRDLLRRGTVLIDEGDAGTTPRVLFYLEHAVQDASLLDVLGDADVLHVHFAAASSAALMGRTAVGHPPRPGEDARVKP